MNKLLGYAPDLDGTTPGVIADGNMFYPTIRGVAAYPYLADVMPAITQPDLAWARTDKDDRDIELFAASTGSVQVSFGGNWANVTGSITGVVADFTAFGDVTLASDISSGLHVQTGGNAAFTAVATSPRPKILFTAGGYVIAANGNMTAGGGENKPDAWAISNVFDYATWTPAIGNSADYGRLYSPSGAITAGAALGDRPVLYKRNAIFIGYFDGAKWLWPAVQNSTIGCIGKNALVAAEGQHWFFSGDDFYRFDGTTPVSIGSDLRLTVRERHTEAQIRDAQAVYDKRRQCVIWFIGDFGYAYSVIHGRWGRVDIGPATFVRGVGSVLPVIPGEAANITADGWRSGVMGFTGGQLGRSGDYGLATIVGGDMGDPNYDVCTIGASIRFSRWPDDARGSATNQYKRVYHDEYTDDLTSPLIEDRFDWTRSDRWHRVKLSLVGDWELAEFSMFRPKNAHR